VSLAKRGRPPIKLDEAQISEWISKGYTVEWVADYFDVAISTLYLNYSDALRKGRVRRDGCLQAKQLEVAMSGDRTMMVWMGKQFLKQKDKIETSESNGDTFGISDFPEKIQDAIRDDRPN